MLCSFEVQRSSISCLSVLTLRVRSSLTIIVGLAQALPNPRTQPGPEAMVWAGLLILLAQQAVGLESNSSDADAECLLQSRQGQLVSSLL